MLEQVYKIQKQLDNLEDLYNFKFITLKEYKKIKDRILLKYVTLVPDDKDE